MSRKSEAPVKPSPDKLASLPPEVREYIESLERANAEQSAEIERLSAIISRYAKWRFGPRADMPPKAKAARGVPDTSEPAKAGPGRKMGGKNLGSAQNPCRTVMLDGLEELRRAHPGSVFEKVSEREVTVYELESVSVKAVRYVIAKYKDQFGHFYEARVPGRVCNCPASASLLADCAASKYALGVPEYRIAKWLRSQGLPGMGPRTVNNWNSYVAEALEGLCSSLPGLILSGSGTKNVHVDETTLSVIDARKEGRQKCYAFVMEGEIGGRKASYYWFSEDRRTDDLKEMIRENSYSGSVTADGYSGYDFLKEEGIPVQRCWVHVRRRFAETFNSLKDPEAMRKSPGYGIVGKIDLLFREERRFREEKLSPEGILEERKKPEYLSICRSIKESINALNPRPGTDLDKAKKYYLNQEGELWTFLGDGNLVLTNNAAENAVKYFASVRKNMLHCKSYAGAAVSCCLMTLIGLAFQNDYDPRAYIEFLLMHRDEKDIAPLLPWGDAFREWSAEKGIAKLR